MLNSNCKKHEIFSDISKYIEFYKSLSYSILSFTTTGISKSICNIDSHIISSIQGTIESIKMIIQEGRINDAYALTRKYYDSVIINIYEILYLKRNFSIENFVVEKINNWFHDKEKLPRFSEMGKYIKESSELTKVNQILGFDERYEELRSRCNDHMHYNLFYYMMSNDNENYINRLKLFDVLACDIQDIFIMHFVYLFTLNEHYMASSDYLDCLECGMAPEEDSQYYVAPFIQETFDEVIKIHRADLAGELKNATNMKLK